jgi:translin
VGNRADTADKAEVTLADLVEQVRGEMGTISEHRDRTLQLARALTRSCAHSIRAIHRHEWADAEAMLAQARADAAAMVQPLAAAPTVYYAGYTQDALKELVEAHSVHAVVRSLPMPTPSAMYGTGATYLRGLTEAATEMRRFVLDLMRRGQIAEAEPLLDFMEEVYHLLVAVDYPDAITDGLRRQTDVLRNVLEKTRGDLTVAVRQEQLRGALHDLVQRLDAAGSGLNADELAGAGSADDEAMEG